MTVTRVEVFRPCPIALGPRERVRDNDVFVVVVVYRIVMLAHVRRGLTDDLGRTPRARSRVLHASSDFLFFIITRSDDNACQWLPSRFGHFSNLDFPFGMSPFSQSRCPRRPASNVSGILGRSYFRRFVGDFFEYSREQFVGVITF